MSEPLFLQSVMQEKIWGGTHLRDVFGYDIPSDHVGEYWAISAHPNGVSTIKNGRYAGQTLDVLYAEHRELFGNRQEPVFPLLTKILDANDWLSVQVHPDDAYGLEHEGELGKTECWYIIAAEPGAEIIYGHNAKSKEELRQQIESKDWENLLTKVPVRAGDFFYVPSGTMHAIGAVSWFLKRNNLVIRPTVFMILTVKMIKVTCVNSILKNLSMSLISVSQPTVDQSQQK